MQPMPPIRSIEAETALANAARRPKERDRILSQLLLDLLQRIEGESPVYVGIANEFANQPSSSSSSSSSSSPSSTSISKAARHWAKLWSAEKFPEVFTLMYHKWLLCSISASSPLPQQQQQQVVVSFETYNRYEMIITGVNRLCWKDLHKNTHEFYDIYALLVKFATSSSASLLLPVRLRSDIHHCIVRFFPHYELGYQPREDYEEEEVDNHHDDDDNISRGGIPTATTTTTITPTVATSDATTNSMMLMAIRQRGQSASGRNLVEYETMEQHHTTTTSHLTTSSLQQLLRDGVRLSSLLQSLPDLSIIDSISSVDGGAGSAFRTANRSLHNAAADDDNGSKDAYNNNTLLIIPSTAKPTQRVTAGAASLVMDTIDQPNEDSIQRSDKSTSEKQKKKKQILTSKATHATARRIRHNAAVYVGELVRHLRGLTNEEVLVHYLRTSAALAYLSYHAASPQEEQQQQHSTNNKRIQKNILLTLDVHTANRLACALTLYMIPGGPMYTTRQVRNAASTAMDILFPVGSSARRLVHLCFRLLQPTHVPLSFLHWMQQRSAGLHKMFSHFHQLLLKHPWRGNRSSSSSRSNSSWLVLLLWKQLGGFGTKIWKLWWGMIWFWWWWWPTSSIQFVVDVVVGIGVLLWRFVTFGRDTLNCVRSYVSMGENTKGREEKVKA